jgi:hypothetical protein
MTLKIVHCLRCGKDWATRQERPRICPYCKNAYWDVPRIREKKSEYISNSDLK